MNTIADTANIRAPIALAPRQPARLQLFVLLAVSSLAALVTAVLGPSLPAMQAHFAGTRHADVLVPLIMSAPALSMALLCIVAGELADRWGRKRLLVISAVAYAVVGTMPLYLDSLQAILISRFVLGAFEAVLMTVATALIGDYYSGSQRDRYMALQTTATSITAVVVSLIGGVLATYDWRTPYAAFGVSLLMVPMILVHLWEPMTRATMSAVQLECDRRAFRLGYLAWRSLLGFVAGLAFLILSVHFGYLLKSIGVDSTQQVGTAYAIYSVGMIVGTFMFGWAMAPRLSVAISIGTGTLLAGMSLAALPYTHDYTSMVAAGACYGIGLGIILPVLVAWNMRELPLSMRGLGTGAFQSSLFLGMFLSPAVVVVLEKFITGPRVAAIAIEGYALIALGVSAFLIGLARRRSRPGGIGIRIES